MKRILSIFIREMKSSFREFLLIYLIIVPIIIAIGLRFFIPAVNSISYNFVIDKALGREAEEEFARYGRVETADGIESIKKRVGKVDDIAGISKTKDGYQLTLEGNEDEAYKTIAGLIIARMQGRSPAADIRISDIGVRMSSVAVYGSSAVMLMAVVLLGMVIGLNIIQEKEAGTINALNVTPMRKAEFIAGKSLAGLIIPVIEAFLILKILGLNGINMAMLAVMIIASSFIAIIFGFLIGVLSSNQISGIANMKFLLLIVSGSFVGAVALPQSFHKLLYWSPLYWSTIGLNEIIMNMANWIDVGYYSIWILSLSVIVFILCKGRIERGLMGS